MIHDAALLNQEFRDENSSRNYPFSDVALFAASGVEFPKDAIIDALLHVPGSSRVCMSRYNGTAKRIEFADSVSGDSVGYVDYANGDFTVWKDYGYSQIIESGGWYVLANSARVAVGTVVVLNDPALDFQFAVGDMDLAPSCMLASAIPGVSGIAVGNVFVPGPVMFRGVDGVVAYSFISPSGESVVKFQGVGDTAAELATCYSLPDAATAICVSQEAGSTVGFADASVMSYTLSSPASHSLSVAVVGTLVDDLYAGHILVTDQGDRVRILSNASSGGTTTFHLDGYVSGTSVEIVVPNILYITHRSLYTTLYSGTVSFHLPGSGAMHLFESYAPDILVGSYIAVLLEDGTSSCGEITSNLGNLVTVELDRYPDPAAGAAYTIQREGCTALSDVCGATSGIGQPLSPDVADPCDPNVPPGKPCSLAAVPNKCYYPINGALWILSGAVDRPLMGVSARQVPVLNSVADRSGTVTEISETRGTLTISTRGTSTISAQG